MRKFIVLALALAGFAVTAWTVFADDSAAPVAVAPAAFPASPFRSYVAGTGITEASTGNIAIGTPVPGIVSAVDVTWGERVKAGAPLLTIDDRDLKAQLPLAQAKVAQAEADLAKAQNLLKVGADLRVGTSISQVDLENRRYDVRIKQAALDAAKAAVAQIDSTIARHTIRAPVEGTVLQINTRIGEYAASGPVDPPLMIFGDDRTLNLKVGIDEEDAWRVSSHAQAVAFLRGDPTLRVKLKFVRFEPYLVPKTLLTGSSSERSDTRVLDVVYSFPKKSLPVFVGQEMNVFVEAPPLDAVAARKAPGAGD